MAIFNNSEIKKLMVVPIAASIIVFKISATPMFASKIVSSPPAVLNLVVLMVCCSFMKVGFRNELSVNYCV